MQRRDLLRLAALVAAAVLIAAAIGVGIARAGTFSSFRTPSGNIGCVYSSGFGQPTSLRCDIRSGLQPRPQRPPGCTHLNWGDSYEMNSTGSVGVTCHGDTAILPNSRVLRYGSSWAKGGFVCTSRATGLRCRNRSGHGFFLSRVHSYRF